MYPGEERVHPAEDRGIAGACSTVQLANLRRGLQDHLYLTLARRYGLDAVVDEALQAVTPRLFSDAGESVGFAEHGDAFEAVRRKLGVAIAAKAGASARASEPGRATGPPARREARHRPRGRHRRVARGERGDDPGLRHRPRQLRQHDGLVSLVPGDRRLGEGAPRGRPGPAPRRDERTHELSLGPGGLARPRSFADRRAGLPAPDPGRGRAPHQGGGRRGRNRRSGRAGPGLRPQAHAPRLAPGRSLSTRGPVRGARPGLAESTAFRSVWRGAIWPSTRSWPRPCRRTHR